VVNESGAKDFAFISGIATGDQGQHQAFIQVLSFQQLSIFARQLGTS